MAAMVKKSVKFVQASAYKVNRDACSVDYVGSVEYIGSASKRAARKACTSVGYDYDFVKVDGETIKTYAMDVDDFVKYAREVDADGFDAPDAPADEM